MTEKVLNTAEVADRFGLTRGRIIQLIHAGVIPAEKWGRDYQILEENLKSASWSRKKGKKLKKAVLLRFPPPPPPKR